MISTKRKRLSKRIGLVFAMSISIILSCVTFSATTQTAILNVLGKGRLNDIGLDLQCDLIFVDLFSHAIRCEGLVLRHEGQLVFETARSHVQWEHASLAPLEIVCHSFQMDEAKIDIAQLSRWLKNWQDTPPSSSDNSIESIEYFNLIINDLKVSNFEVFNADDAADFQKIDSLIVEDLHLHPNHFSGHFSRLIARSNMHLAEQPDEELVFQIEQCTGDFLWESPKSWEFEDLKIESSWGNAYITTFPDSSTQLTVEPNWSNMRRIIPINLQTALAPITEKLECQPIIVASTKQNETEGTHWKLQLGQCEDWSLATDHCTLDQGADQLWRIRGSWNLSHLLRQLEKAGIREKDIGLKNLDFAYLRNGDFQLNWDLTAQEQQLHLKNAQKPNEHLTFVGLDPSSQWHPQSYSGLFGSIFIPIQGFQSSPWRGDYHIHWESGELIGQLESQNKSGESFEIYLSSEATSERGIQREGALQGHIIVRTTELPIELTVEAGWDSTGWEASGDLDILGMKAWTLGGDSTWQLFAQADIRSSGRGRDDWGFSFETRNINLLENGRPRAFNRLDVIGRRSRDEISLELNSDVMDGMARIKHAEALTSTGSMAWFDQVREAFTRGLEIELEGSIHHFKPIQLLTNLPIHLDSQSSVVAALNSNDAFIEIDLPKIIGSDWEANQVKIHGTLDQGRWFTEAEMRSFIVAQDTLAVDVRSDIAGNDEFEAVLEWNRPEQLEKGTLELTFSPPWEKSGEMILENITWPMMNQVFASNEKGSRIQWKRNSEWSSWTISPLEIQSSDWDILVHGEVSGAGDVDLSLRTLSKSNGIQFAEKSGKVEFDRMESWTHVCGNLIQPEIEAKINVIGLEWRDEHFDEISFQAEGKLDQTDATLQLNWTENSFATASGKVNFLQNEVIWMDVDVNEVPLRTLRFILPQETIDFQGAASGEIHTSGPWRALELEGGLSVNSANISVPYLGTSYVASGIVNITPASFELNQWNISDASGHSAKLNGTLFHSNFAKWDVDFGIDANEEALIMIDLEPSIDQLFFGKALGQGDVNISGFGENLVIDANLTAGKGTQFALPLDAVSDATYASFIRFESANEVKPPRKQASEFSNIQMNLAIDVDSEAEARIIFDQNVGDEIIGRCTGHIDLTVDDFERLEMTGDLTVVEGAYFFTLQNLINKRFEILPGGTISWLGDPYDASIDLSAIYQVRSSLNGLLPEATDLPGVTPVQLNLALEGSLLEPSIGFGIEIPGASSRIQSLVDEALTNEEELQRQAISLLVINQFISPDPFMATVGGFLNREQSSELLVNQIGHWISQLSSTLDVGVDYSNDQNSGEQELALALSTQLLNDRMHIEGAVGAQGMGQLNPNDIQIQDFTISYDLDPEGHYQITGHSKSNRLMNNAFDGTTTQGVGIRMRREFDRWGDWRERPNALNE